jgi:hypothetical protein
MSERWQYAGALAAALRPANSWSWWIEMTLTDQIAFCMKPVGRSIRRRSRVTIGLRPAPSGSDHVAVLTIEG